MESERLTGIPQAASTAARDAYNFVMGVIEAMTLIDVSFAAHINRDWFDRFLSSTLE
jgi:hypothetical protein